MPKKTPTTQPTEEQSEFNLIVSGNLPTITSNFDELKAAIILRLKDYEIEVTEENLAAAKKDATELGKAALQLNKLKSEKAKEFSEPIEAFKAQVLELVELIKTGQDKIKAQVKVFEDKVREQVKALMLEYIKELHEAWAIRPEYQKSWKNVEAISGLSLITKSGQLSKAGKETVEGWLRTDKGKQDQADLRVAQLENLCLKAGLTAPLSREHVAAFIDDNEEFYQEKVARLIQIEIDRQKQVEGRAREAERLRVEAEAKAKAEAEAKAAEPTPAPPAPAPPAPTPTTTALPLPPTTLPLPPNTKRQVEVAVRFLIETTKHSPQDINKIHGWFQQEISKIPGVPSFEIKINLL